MAVSTLKREVSPEKGKKLVASEYFTVSAGLILAFSLFKNPPSQPKSFYWTENLNFQYKTFSGCELTRWKRVQRAAADVKLIQNGYNVKLKMYQKYSQTLLKTT